MQKTTSNEIVFRRADDALKEELSALIVERMAEILKRFPVEELRDDQACYGRLLTAGFGATTIFHLSSEARYRAWAAIRPREACRDAYGNWLISARKIPVPSSYQARQ